MEESDGCICWCFLPRNKGMAVADLWTLNEPFVQAHSRSFMSDDCREGSFPPRSHGQKVAISAGLELLQQTPGYMHYELLIWESVNLTIWTKKGRKQPMKNSEALIFMSNIFLSSIILGSKIAQHSKKKRLCRAKFPDWRICKGWDLLFCFDMISLISMDWHRNNCVAQAGLKLLIFLFLPPEG